MASGRDGTSSPNHEFRESFEEQLGPINETAESDDLSHWSADHGGQGGSKPRKRVTHFQEATAPVAAESVPEVLRRTGSANPGRALVSDRQAEMDLSDLLASQHSEVMSRLLYQDELLKLLVTPHVVAPPAELEAAATASVYQHPATRRTVQSARSTKRSTTRSDEKADSKPSRASQGLGPRIFHTFTQVDNSLKQAAATIAAQRARKKYVTDREASPSRGLTSKEATFLQQMVDHILFDIFFAFLVLLNSVFIGIEVQSSISSPDSKDLAFYAVQYALAAFFFAELVLRLLAWGYRELFCGEDWMWTLLDTFIVVSSLLDIVLDILVLVLWRESTVENPVSSLRAFRMLRLARIVKAVRLMRVFRFVRALRTLITSIFHTLKSLFWALVLLVLIVYVFGILFCQAVNNHLLDPGASPMSASDLQASAEYYDSLAGTMLSLFMCISGGVSWQLVLAPLKAISVFWVFLFVFFIAFTYFAVLNVLTAVFCQSAIASAENDQSAIVQTILEEKEAHCEKLVDLFSRFGEDRDVITFELFEEKINEPAVRDYFSSIGLDVWDAWSFFKLLDLDQGGAVEIDEFLMGCLRLRGHARAVDVGKIIHDQTWLIRNQSHFQTYVELQLKQMQDLLGRLAGVRLHSVHVLARN
mmetsp:Transcript_55225/g.128837  ORF Transcript_55225/g.128837 Transcript_55225/m.128837 type:complete len:645 (-) Transcript_55225:179-2113(-)